MSMLSWLWQSDQEPQRDAPATGQPGSATPDQDTVGNAAVQQGIVPEEEDEGILGTLGSWAGSAVDAVSGAASSVASGARGLWDEGQARGAELLAQGRSAVGDLVAAGGQAVDAAGSFLSETGSAIASGARELWDQGSAVVGTAADIVGGWFEEDTPITGEQTEITGLNNQFYGHGGFMGAAPAMMRDERWNLILQTLMPDVHRTVTEAMQGGASAGDIMPMFENNPVMSAYGMVHSVVARQVAAASGEPVTGEHDLEGMEWDVFIDGDLADKFKEEGDTSVVPGIIDTMVIAHAGTVDTIQENKLGIDQYQDVRETALTEMGGVQTGAWMDLFGRALRLQGSADLAAACEEMAGEERNQTDEATSNNTFARPLPISEVLQIYRDTLHLEFFSVILDIKSRSITANLLRAMVAELNTRGIHVAGVGSFIRDEIAGVGEQTQIIDGVEAPPAREVWFMHYAGDLQARLREGEVPSGQSVMFNGASLLEADTMATGDAAERDATIRASYRVKQAVVDELRTAKEEHDLHLGLYVQEGDTDATAADLLTQLSNRESATFDLGFAWGGLRDQATGEMTADVGDANLGYGGQGALGYVGAAQQWETEE